MKISWRFNPEVFTTKTFQALLASLVGAITAFGAGELGWRGLGASVAAFVVLTCFRDGLITFEKAVQARDCPPAEEAPQHTEAGK